MQIRKKNVSLIMKIRRQSLITIMDHSNSKPHDFQFHSKGKRVYHFVFSDNDVILPFHDRLPPPFH